MRVRLQLQLPMRRRGFLAQVGAQGVLGVSHALSEACDLALQAVDVFPLLRDRLVEILDHTVLVGDADFEGVDARLRV